MTTGEPPREDVPSDASGSTPASPAPSGAADRRRSSLREALITVAVLVVAAAIVVGLVFAGRLSIPGFGGPSVPGSGEIWFGESYDASTFVIANRWTSATIGRPIAAVAHLSRPVGAGEATLRILADGALIASQPLTDLAGRGDLIGLKFTPPDTGTYTFTIVDATGATLASGTIAAP